MIFFVCFVFILDDNEGPTVHIPPMNHHVKHLSPFGPVSQISPMTSYTQLSPVKHLEPQLPTVSAPSESYTTQAHASYGPVASYGVPSVGPFDHVHTILKPYHTSMPAVKHIEPHMNSIVPMHSISPVTTYNPMTSTTLYGPVHSGAQFEHFQNVVKPYPVYIREEQHPSAYVMEQSLPTAPTPPIPPTPPTPSNFWHPETFVYNKPTFTYHNSPGMPI